eukprot:PITA_08571
MFSSLSSSESGIFSRTGTAFESRLLQDAAKTLATAKEKTRFNAPESAEKKGSWRRFVMNTLRIAGYNAAICNSRWEQSRGHPAGDYEFIDVVMEESISENDRFLVDIDFKEQFEIARPTVEYNALLQRLPVLFVGREDKLIEIIKIMCDAARRSLKERGMYMRPWRKYGYMQAKWVGCYKRTTNLVPRATPQDSSLQFPFSGITLKGMQCDARVDHQREKAKNAADRNLEAKSKSTDQGNNQLEQRDRYENKISGLAMALAEAGLTPSSPSIGT